MIRREQHTSQAVHVSRFSMSVKIVDAVSLFPNADSDLVVVPETARALIKGNVKTAIEKRFEKRIVNPLCFKKGKFEGRSDLDLLLSTAMNESV